MTTPALIGLVALGIFASLTLIAIVRGSRYDGGGTDTGYTGPWSEGVDAGTTARDTTAR